MRELLLYTRPGCTLCDDLLVRAEPVVRRHGAMIRKVNIDNDPELRRRYGWDIPVLEVDGQEICRHQLDAAALEQALVAE